MQELRNPIDRALLVAGERKDHSLKRFEEL